MDNDGSLCEIMDNNNPIYVYNNDNCVYYMMRYNDH